MTMMVIHQTVNAHQHNDFSWPSSVALWKPNPATSWWSILWV
jgi:hypothetical protein